MSKSYDKPINEQEPEDDEGHDPAYASQIFELRCCHFCEIFLPLDRPARVLLLEEDDDETAVAVCTACVEIHGI